MQISVFLSGFETIIGVRNPDETPIVKCFESIILFKDPMLFKDRLLNLLNYQFGITDIKSITRMVFGINGDINYDLGSIHENHFIDNVLFAKSFNGYPFKNIFGSIIGKDNVFVVNDVLAISLGIASVYPQLSRPFFVLYGAWGMGVSYINVGGQIITTNLGHEIIPNKYEFSLHKLLGKESIELLIQYGSTDIYADFTNNFIEAANYLIPRINDLSKQQGLESAARPVFVWMTSEEYLKKEELSSTVSGELFFPENESIKNLIPTLGCLDYPEYKENLNAIISNIEYYSGLERIYMFEKYEEFLKHWNSVHTFANPENEYKVNYKNKAIKIIKMQELEREDQLMEYKF